MITPIHIIAAAVAAYTQFISFKCRRSCSGLPDRITGYDAENALRAEEADAMLRELNRTASVFGSDGDSQSIDRRIGLSDRTHAAGYDISTSVSSPARAPAPEKRPAVQPTKKPAVQVGIKISPIVWHLLLAILSAAVVAIVHEIWRRTQ